MNDNIRIIIDGGDMFDGNIAQFEDCFGGVGGSLGGVVRFCQDMGSILETEENGIRTGYIVYGFGDDMWYETFEIKED